MVSIGECLARLKHARRHTPRARSGADRLRLPPAHGLPLAPVVCCSCLAAPHSHGCFCTHMSTTPQNVARCTRFHAAPEGACWLFVRHAPRARSDSRALGQLDSTSKPQAYPAWAADQHTIVSKKMSGASPCCTFCRMFANGEARHTLLSGAVLLYMAFSVTFFSLV